MGRLIAHRYVIEGDLVAETAIHIGGALGDLVTDMPLARDGADRFYIPGTSLAGPIRRWWSRRRSETEVVFGRIAEKQRGDQEPGARKDAGHASFIVVDDAPVVGEPITEIRDGVGIDRETGSAAEGIKYDREVMPRGTTFRFHMEVDLATGTASMVPEKARDEHGKPKDLPRPDADALERSLASLIVALEKGDIRFGAAKTRGLGRLTLARATVRKHDIGDQKGILTYLTDGPAAARDVCSDLVDKADAGRPLAEIDLVVTWHPDLPVMNKSDAEGVSVDALPLVTAAASGLVPIITGASWKGVLRAHGERICRTLSHAKPSDRAADKAAARKRDSAQEFLDDLAECELIEALFGARGKKRGEEEQYRKAEGPIPGLGALSADDCVIGAPVSHEQWRELLTAAGSPDGEQKTVVARTVLDSTGWKEFRAATHVAIDRWTGGAAENLLFSRLEPAAKGGRELRLSLDLDRLAQRLPANAQDGGTQDRRAGSGPRPSPGMFRKAAFGLMLVMLRELAKGRIPVGYGATRGLGSIVVDRIAFDMTARAAAELELPAEPATGGTDRHAFALTRDDFDEPTSMARFKAVAAAWSAGWPEVHAS
jgi:CRISPR/Cas system CSM-associated protein Csm3 (group 7 of RAMP superfamily)